MTQYTRLPTATMLKKAFRSPNHALNIYRRNEDVARDIVYSNVPAIFDGSTAANIFVGTSTKFTDVHGIKKDNQFANILEDNIVQRGAPNCLLSDRGQAIIMFLGMSPHDIVCYNIICPHDVTTSSRDGLEPAHCNPSSFFMKKHY
jgi:hypothetical protein